jgi:hypothetical protein
MIIVDNGALILPQQGGINVTGTHNDVNPGVGAVMYARGLVIGGQVTGFSGEADRLLVVQPTRNSPEEVGFMHQNAGSAAANRFVVADAFAAVTSFFGSTAMFVYDSVDSRWKEVG